MDFSVPADIQTLLDELDFTSDHEAVAAELEHAIVDVQRAIDEMREQKQEISHYGG